jgi:hypothetical protein
MLTKICIKHGELDEKDIHVNKKGWKKCRICARESSTIHRKENKGKVAELNKNWREKNPEYRKNRSQDEKNRVNKLQKQYYHNHKDRYCELRKKNVNRKIAHKIASIELKDSYVKRLITQRSLLNSKDVTPEWIELKRTIVKIKRKLRNKCENKEY